MQAIEAYHISKLGQIVVEMMEKGKLAIHKGQDKLQICVVEGQGKLQIGKIHLPNYKNPNYC